MINYNKIKSSFQKNEKQNAISKNEMFRKKFNFNVSSDKMRIMRKIVFEHFIRFKKLAFDLLFDKKKNRVKEKNKCEKKVLMSLS